MFFFGHRNKIDHLNGLNSQQFIFFYFLITYTHNLILSFFTIIIENVKRSRGFGLTLTLITGTSDSPANAQGGIYLNFFLQNFPLVVRCTRTIALNYAPQIFRIL